MLDSDCSLDFHAELSAIYSLPLINLCSQGIKGCSTEFILILTVYSNIMHYANQ